MLTADVLVVGAGVAGASAAYELAAHARVVLIERESMPGYHSSGRSAALFLETYGNRVVRALTIASRPFYDAPPDGFTDQALLSPRGALFIGPEDSIGAVDRQYRECHELVESVRRIDGAEARRMVPSLRESHVAGAVYEPDAMDIDIHALQQGYLRGLKRRGGTLIGDAELISLERKGELWRAETKAGAIEAPVVANAAGAWCDEVARLAGAKPVGLVPKRRTALIFDGPSDAGFEHWPMVADVGESWYIKPESGRLLASPADETPVPPCDVQPDEFDIALTAHRIEEATTLKVNRIIRKWAGLRSFVADKTLVAGFDDAVPGFFWIAGQGGYGFQTAPAMGQLCAALIRGDGLPAHIAARGVTPDDLSPKRLRG
ncbi:MAG: NAD(P)/FAD-dependent oxidoreductase [Alphaproteobacteria bacterium]